MAAEQRKGVSLVEEHCMASSQLTVRVGEQNLRGHGRSAVEGAASMVTVRTSSDTSMGPGILISVVLTSAYVRQRSQERCLHQQPTMRAAGAVTAISIPSEQPALCPHLCGSCVETCQ